MNAKLKKWNKIDELIFRCGRAVHESRESSSEADVEQMIDAETYYLKKENAELKRKQYPRAALLAGDSCCYLCPECQGLLPFREIAHQQVAYCFVCGQRIYFNDKKDLESERTENVESMRTEIGKCIVEKNT